MSYTDKDGKSTSDGAHTSCRKCGGLTSRVTLGAHGGQCYPCFTDSCRNAAPVARDGQSHTVRDMLTRVKA